jgi:hypothetical protein
MRWSARSEDAYGLIESSCSNHGHGTCDLAIHALILKTYVSISTISDAVTVYRPVASAILKKKGSLVVTAPFEVTLAAWRTLTQHVSSSDDKDCGVNDYLAQNFMIRIH